MKTCGIKSGQNKHFRRDFPLNYIIRSGLGSSNRQNYTVTCWQTTELMLTYRARFHFAGLLLQGHLLITGRSISVPIDANFLDIIFVTSARQLQY